MSDEPKIPRDDPRRQTGRYGPGQDKPTVELPAAPAWAVSMQESINNQFVIVNAHLDTQDHAFNGLQLRVGVLEAAAAKAGTGRNRPFEGPQTTQSGEVRRITSSDLKQNEAITGLSENQVALSDKVDDLRRELEAAKKQVDGVAETQKAQNLTLTDQNTALSDIKGAVSGFFRRHPELTSSFATLLGVIIALATAWFQSKVHQ